ncbi:MAG TPA: hypothetical protein VKE72_09305 [Methylocella sp.]|nr:hypothetical protein [Methylocella sp.]
MTADIDFAALAVFIFFFALVLGMGLAAAHWRQPKSLANIDEWGLGTWLAWTNNFKPLQALHFGTASVTVYSGLLALAVNILVAILISAMLWYKKTGRLARKRYSP